MLEIVESYHRMQFQGKLTNQTWENVKKPNFGSNFSLFCPNLGSKNFFRRFYLHYKLEIVASYQYM